MSNSRLVKALLESIIAQAELLKAQQKVDYLSVSKLRRTVMELEQEVEER